MPRKAKPASASKTQTAKQTVTIDEKEYDLNALSDNAKGQLVSLRLCDQKIQAAQQDIALLQTARNAYAKALSEELAS